ncbi:MAG: ABC transporter substrate-binding protein [Alphaproteobacteria bacterium]|nr:ABC transporter substrate-binding protein [Alphaproteobacteria bacterium]
MFWKINNPAPRKAALFAAAAAFSAFGAAAPAAAESLTIVSWGGVVSDANRSAYWAPYAEATGVEIIDDTFNGELSRIRAQIESGVITWDIAEPEFAEAALGCEEGLFEPLDPAVLPTDDFATYHLGECSVTSLLASTVLTYDASVYDGPAPASWADFWDVDGFPGKRGLNFSVIDSLLIALLADGVPADAVYDVLADKAGQDRAFAKLDALKDHIIWWRSGTEQIQGLLSGEYSMASAWNGRVASAIASESAPLAMAWEAGHLATGNQWVILKGSENKERALDFIKFALQPENQARFMQEIDYSAISRKGHEALSPERLAIMPGNPKFEENGVPPNPDFWLDNLTALNERFQSWAGQ